MAGNNFNFTRQQIEEFIYDVRDQVREPYINIILQIGRTISSGMIVCAVPCDIMDTLVMDARKNLRKTIDEFIKDYNTKATVSVSLNNVIASRSALLQGWRIE